MSKHRVLTGLGVKKSFTQGVWLLSNRVFRVTPDCVHCVQFELRDVICPNDLVVRVRS